MNKIVKISAAFFALLSIGVQADSKMVIKDQCPSLPTEIAEQEPKYGEYVFAKAGDAVWQAEYNEYSKAKEAFQAKFSAEIQQVDLAWRKLEAKQFASQGKFYDVVAEKVEDDDLLNEVKATCWQKVMGVDEFEKDNFCHPLTSSPSKTEWNKILVCTLNRVQLLKIKLQ